MRSLTIAGVVGAATLALFATTTPADGDVRVRVGFGGGHHHHHHRHRHHHHNRHHHGHFYRRQYRPTHHHHYRHYTPPRTTYYYYNNSCSPGYSSYSYSNSSYYQPSSNYYQSSNYYPSSNVNVNLGSTYTSPAQPPVTSTSPQYTYPQQPTYTSPPPQIAPTPTSGWSLLSAGRTQDALKSFAAESTTYPNDPVSKAGYAIAAALEQDDELAIWTMRRALRIDAQALTRVPIDEGLGYQLTALTERYEATLRTQPRRPDLHVMIAALSLIRGDMERAAYSADAATQLGDNDYSVQNLRSAVNLIATSSADL